MGGRRMEGQWPASPAASDRSSSPARRSSAPSRDSKFPYPRPRTSSDCSARLRPSGERLAGRTLGNAWAASRFLGTSGPMGFDAWTAVGRWSRATSTSNASRDSWLTPPPQSSFAFPAVGGSLRSLLVRGEVHQLRVLGFGPHQRDAVLTVALLLVPLGRVRDDLVVRGAEA